jgi:hypothetical protein
VRLLAAGRVPDLELLVRLLDDDNRRASTSAPTAIAIPPSDMMLALNPSAGTG